MPGDRAVPHEYGCPKDTVVVGSRVAGLLVAVVETKHLEKQLAEQGAEVSRGC